MAAIIAYSAAVGSSVGSAKPTQSVFVGCAADATARFFSGKRRRLDDAARACSLGLLDCARAEMFREVFSPD